MNTEMTTPAPKPLYTCSACKLGVLVIDGKVIKGCTCEAPVAGNMSATVKGRGLAGVR